MTASVIDKTPILEAKNVSKVYKVGNHILPQFRQSIHAVDNVSLSVMPGETLGLVGESGCGKSSLGRCLARLQSVTKGEILFKGQDIARYSNARLRPMRQHIQMVFQDPYASLNPRRRIGDLLSEPMVVHNRGSKAEIAERVAELMNVVGLLPEHVNRYPHEFSGGQRQRIGIARALALNPDLIIADEPVSALDVSIQAQVVNLLLELQETFGLTYVFIAHDLSVVRQMATRTAVMYLGAVVELGPTDDVFHRPSHPYTKALLSAVPSTDPKHRRERIILQGDLPSPANLPSGCRFHTRCPIATDRCKVEAPTLSSQSGNRQVACHYPL
ncbi:dipeptide ABC transporter ATP-binding protein [Allorhizobium sp. BGMRC 0089]|uniref:ABC transporter ATP-binding protein n=1 Tax=Allorhizobium sonneratiae TaxID=2934936 RepID=UPI00203367B3|nr:dipeptide ABC transporter ATP-binding protein [Allorhizobium sonneratiae]MCM2293132.1 dipeptide ABC transporter ATP-binding protein [Allorhizobium sonneratiae]